jgi:NADH:ubiquinone oxidoreductase subunit 4 (subunit M)
MITLLLLIPIIGSIIIATIPENTDENKTKMKQIALTTSIINFIFSIYL